MRCIYIYRLPFSLARYDFFFLLFSFTVYIDGEIVTTLSLSIIDLK